jgi:hypothetical protein
MDWKHRIDSLLQATEHTVEDLRPAPAAPLPPMLDRAPLFPAALPLTSPFPEGGHLGFVPGAERLAACEEVVATAR